MSSKKIIIGREEWCAFPTLGIPAIKARVDSGAKTSCMHAFNIHTMMYGSRKWVSFEAHPLQKNRRITIHCKAKVIDRRAIKSSSGHTEKRYVIQLPMQIGTYAWEIELTLTNRDSMGYRMLLGREAMIGRVLIDPAVSCKLGDVHYEEFISLYPQKKQRS